MLFLYSIHPSIFLPPTSFPPWLFLHLFLITHLLSSFFSQVKAAITHHCLHLPTFSLLYFRSCCIQVPNKSRFFQVCSHLGCSSGTIGSGLLSRRETHVFSAGKQIYGSKETLISLILGPHECHTLYAPSFFLFVSVHFFVFLVPSLPPFFPIADNLRENLMESTG